MNRVVFQDRSQWVSAAEQQNYIVVSQGQGSALAAALGQRAVDGSKGLSQPVADLI